MEITIDNAEINQYANQLMKQKISQKVNKIINEVDLYILVRDEVRLFVRENVSNEMLTKAIQSISKDEIIESVSKGIADHIYDCLTKDDYYD